MEFNGCGMMRRCWVELTCASEESMCAGSGVSESDFGRTSWADKIAAAAAAAAVVGYYYHYQRGARLKEILISSTAPRLR